MRKIYFIVLFISLFINACAVLDMPARFLGISNQKFKDASAARTEQTFALSKREAFDRALKILEIFEARPTRKSFNKGYIVAFEFSTSFNYCLDSTEVAFFFNAIDDKNTKIEIAANNSLLIKEMAPVFFKMMADADLERENVR
jgi:hypothetical protein